MRHRLVTATGSTLVAALLMLIPAVAEGYPEFHEFVHKNSSRPIDCAMCHSHPDGPEGSGFGQVGSLDEAERASLVRARSASEPGHRVDNPLLNEFGDSLLMWLGRDRLAEMKLNPAALAEAIPSHSDLDNDGIPGYQEYLDGTHPLKASDGDPWKLFLTNVQRSAFDLTMIVIATFLGIWGLSHLIRGFYAEEHSAPRPTVDLRPKIVPRRRV